MSVKCFLLESVPDAKRVWLRRYIGGSHCPGPMSYHDAMNLVGDVESEFAQPADDDPRWPTVCSCGFEFGPLVIRQVFECNLYRRADTGEVTTLREAPAGAMWIATWMNDHLIVKLPGGHDWDVDSRCSNCSRPGDNVHRCWVRHGEPPNVTVDKNGDTCAAGQGSVLVPGWHGLLRNGELVT